MKCLYQKQVCRKPVTYFRADVRVRDLRPTGEEAISGRSGLNRWGGNFPIVANLAFWGCRSIISRAQQRLTRSWR